MIEDIATAFCCFQHEEDALFYFFLTDELGEGGWAQRYVEGCRWCFGCLLVEVFGHPWRDFKF